MQRIIFHPKRLFALLIKVALKSISVNSRSLRTGNKVELTVAYAAGSLKEEQLFKMYGKSWK
ncbi:hypothetical protein [Niabella beijingensis]|uniref:hypothetical protein n=1 Tax=Niabella beijingensis TaxID=2872700 RepID=UPI001CC0A8DE|nr:hypothetical protein [Niabella beijingensis]MBZ4187790.1 hypothetical protein [Niabella beijingensis]